MNLDKVRINLSFELEYCSDDDIEKIKEILNFKGEIINKKFIDFFSIEKRPLVVTDIQKMPYSQTHGIDDVYTHYLTEINIKG